MRFIESDSTGWIFRNCDLFFDPDEKLNASLYLCLPRRKLVPRGIINKMRQKDIWSDAEEQIVTESKRDTYRQQLKFIDAHLCCCESEFVVISRFDHRCFPSDDDRWASWVQFFACGPLKD